MFWRNNFYVKFHLICALKINQFYTPNALKIYYCCFYCNINDNLKNILTNMKIYCVIRYLFFESMNTCFYENIIFKNRKNKLK